MHKRGTSLVAKTPHSQSNWSEGDSWSGNLIPHAKTKSSHATAKTWSSQINIFLKILFIYLAAPGLSCSMWDLAP